jgi:hypothetical protein
VHRLKAVILADQEASGLAVPMWIFPNCDARIFEVIDRGFSRNQAALFIAKNGGRSNAGKVCSIGRSMLRGIAKGNWNTSLSLDECVDHSLKHEALIREILKACRSGDKRSCPYYSNGWSGAAANASFYYGVEEVVKHINRYINLYDENNVPLPKHDPMFVLREHYRLNHENTRNGTAAISRDFHLYPWAVTAFRAALQGERLNEKKLTDRTISVTLDPKGNTTFNWKVPDFGEEPGEINMNDPDSVKRDEIGATIEEMYGDELDD